MAKYYICAKEGNNTVCGYLNHEKITGFKIKPKNNIKYDGIEVSKLTLLEPSLIQKVLKRKTQNKLNAYLRFLIEVIDDSDTDPDDLVFVLDEVKSYKALIINKYAPFLDPKYIKSILLKVKFVEDELKSRMYENSLYITQSKGRGR